MDKNDASVSAVSVTLTRLELWLTRALESKDTQGATRLGTFEIAVNEFFDQTNLLMMIAMTASDWQAVIEFADQKKLTYRFEPADSFMTMLKGLAELGKRACSATVP